MNWLRQLFALALLCLPAKAATVVFTEQTQQGQPIANTLERSVPIQAPFPSPPSFISASPASWVTSAQGTYCYSNYQTGLYQITLQTSPVTTYDIWVPPGTNAYQAWQLQVPANYVAPVFGNLIPVVNTVLTNVGNSCVYLSTNGGFLQWNFVVNTNTGGTGGGSGLIPVVNTVLTNVGTASLSLSTNGSFLQWNLVVNTNIETLVPIVNTAGTNVGTASLSLSTNGSFLQWNLVVNTNIETLVPIVNTAGTNVGTASLSLSTNGSFLQWNLVVNTNIETLVPIVNTAGTNVGTASLSLSTNGSFLQWNLVVNTNIETLVPIVNTAGTNVGTASLSLSTNGSFLQWNLIVNTNIGALSAGSGISISNFFINVTNGSVVVNGSYFGITGDNVTENYSQMTNALTNIAVTGGVLALGPGHYKFLTNFALPKNVSISGVGFDPTYGAGGTVLDFENNQSPNWDCCIDAFAFGNSVISGVELRNSSNNIPLLFVGGTTLGLENVMISGYNANGSFLPRGIIYGGTGAEATTAYTASTNAVFRGYGSWQHNVRYVYLTNAVTLNNDANSILIDKFTSLFCYGNYFIDTAPTNLLEKLIIENGLIENQYLTNSIILSNCVNPTVRDVGGYDQVAGTNACIILVDNSTLYATLVGNAAFPDTGIVNVGAGQYPTAIENYNSVTLSPEGGLNLSATTIYVTGLNGFGDAIYTWGSLGSSAPLNLGAYNVHATNIATGVLVATNEIISTNVTGTAPAFWAKMPANNHSGAVNVTSNGVLYVWIDTNMYLNLVNPILVSPGTGSATPYFQQIYNPNPSNYSALFDCGPVFVASSTATVIFTNAWLYTPGAGTNEEAAVTFTPVVTAAAASGIDETFAVPVTFLFTNAATQGAVLPTSTGLGAVDFTGIGGFAGLTGYSIILTNGASGASRAMTKGNHYLPMNYE